MQSGTHVASYDDDGVMQFRHEDDGPMVVREANADGSGTYRCPAPGCLFQAVVAPPPKHIEGEPEARR